MKKNLIIGPTLVDFSIQLQNLQNRKVDTTFSVGGKGFNIAMDLIYLGAPVYLSTAISNDDLGTYVKDTLEINNIEYASESIIASGDINTGVFTVINSEKGDQLFDKAQTEIYELHTLDFSKLKDLNSICVFSNLNSKILNSVKRFVKTSNIPVIFELAGRKDIEKTKEFFDIATLFICNEREFQYVIESYDVNENSIEQQMKTIFEKLGVETLVVTLGEEGIAYFHNGYYSKVSQKQVSKNIVSTVGAGDSITASIIAYHFQNGEMFDDILINKSQENALKVIESNKPYLS